MTRALFASVLCSALAIAPAVGAQREAAPLPPAETDARFIAAPAPEPETSPGARPVRHPDPPPHRAAQPHLDPDPDRDGEDPDRGAASNRGEDVILTLGDAMGDLGDILGADQEPRGRVRWDPSWPRYRFDELVVTLGMGFVILLEELLPTRTDANWREATDVDLEVGRALGLPTPEARDMVEEISDAMLAAMIVWPVVIDPLLYAGLGEGASDVAWQLSLISLEAFSLNHALNVLVRLLARRERPIGRYCREDPDYNDPLCDDQPPSESFWSVHVSNAFTGAALVCAQHDALDLYGETWSDGLACGTAVAAAAATGLMRLMSDSTWVTDVISGAVVGTLIGAIVPYLLHFRGGAHPPLSGQELPTITFYPMMGGDVLGVAAMGQL